MFNKKVPCLNSASRIPYKSVYDEEILLVKSRSNQHALMILYQIVKYILIVTLCGILFYICMIHCSASSPAELEELESGKDDAKKAFHQLMAVIDKALTQAQQALNKAVDQVKATAAKLEDQAKGQLNQMLVPLRKQLDDLIAKAKAKGFDIAKCQKYIDQFSNTPNDLVHNLIDCFNQQIGKAQGYVNDALNNAKKIEQDLNAIDKDIDNCNGNKWKQAQCYAKIIVKIGKDTKEGPQHIAEDVTKATALVTGIVPILQQCFANQVKKAGSSATKDVTDFAICAAIPI